VLLNLKYQHQGRKTSKQNFTELLIFSNSVTGDRFGGTAAATCL